MEIQLLFIFLAIILLIVYQNRVNNGGLNYRKAHKNYIISLCILLILQSGLRNIAVGADTFAYSHIFVDTMYTSWGQIIDNFQGVYIEGEGKDPGYTLLEKIFQIFSTNYQIYLIAIATFFFVAFGRLLFRMTSTLQEVLLGVVVYQVLFYSFLSVTGIRQTIATAIVLYAYPLIVNRRFIKFLILCLIAITIHKSAILFIPLYFLAKIRTPYLVLLISLFATPLILVFARQFALLLTSFSFTESYANYSNSDYETTGAQSFMMFMVIITIMLFVARKRINLNSENTRISIIAFSIGLMLTPLTWVDPSMMRAVMYFSFFLLFLIGQASLSIEKYYKIPHSLLEISLLIIFVYTIIKHNSTYAFFWQEMALPENY